LIYQLAHLRLRHLNQKKYGSESYMYKPSMFKHKSIYDEQLLKEYKDFDITTDGIEYDYYSAAPYSIKSKYKSIKQCGFCNKIYPEFVTVPYDMGSCCWHCLFFLNSSNLDNIEGMYQISVQSYLDFCGPAHKNSECMRPDSCLLCLSGIGISTVDLKPEKEDPKEMERFISMVETGSTDVVLQDKFDLVLDI
jgi:hypothetical protein